MSSALSLSLSLSRIIQTAMVYHALKPLSSDLIETEGAESSERERTLEGQSGLNGIRLTHTSERPYIYVRERA